MKYPEHVTDVCKGLLASLLATSAITSNAQIDCSDLSVEHLWYAAFTDTALELSLLNNSGAQIDYPWFSLVDSNTDTVARSFGSFFVLPTGSVLNHVPATMGMALPTSPFNGEVVLHYEDFPNGGTCTFPVTNIDLCPPLPCAEAVLYAWPMDTVGDPLLFWTIRDDANNIVASGDLQAIIGDPVSSMDSICLPPGNYELEIEQSPFAVPGAFGAMMMRRLFDQDGPSVQFTQNGVLPFTFFPLCTDGTNAIAGEEALPLIWSLNGSMLTVTHPIGAVLGNVDVFSVQGSRVVHRQVNASSAMLDLSGHSPGVYLLRCGTDIDRRVQRFILH